MQIRGLKTGPGLFIALLCVTYHRIGNDYHSQYKNSPFAIKNTAQT